MDASLVLDFLNQLKTNNNREWFQENKKWYEAAKKEVETFVTAMITSISAIDPALQTPAMKDCMFRIFRDVRFGADKSPYKTNFGAFIARGGRKSNFPGYYFHFEPGQCMLAAGLARARRACGSNGSAATVSSSRPSSSATASSRFSTRSVNWRNWAWISSMV